MRRENVEEFIGDTPLLRLKHLEKEMGLSSQLYAKMECYNLTGSAKDRAAYYMILDAEERGVLKPGGMIIEPTSGNTGIALAAIGRNRGYKVVIVMPDTMSKERIALMKAYGAEVILSPGKEGMKGAIAKAEDLSSKTPGSFIPDQFSNPANPRAHYETTGPEIEHDLDGKIDALVAGVGTGGTLTGISRYLRERGIAFKTIAVEPDRSAVLSGEAPGSHGIQGIGGGFIPKALDVSLIDEIIRVKDEEAYASARKFAATESILVGISSGAALHAMIELAKRPEYCGKNIVGVLPDHGDRYLSAGLFEDW